MRDTQRSVWAVVPVKQTARAKQRLAATFSQELRQRLALAMAEDVLAVLSECPLAGLLVVTSDRAVIELAGRYSARILFDDKQDGETAAVQRASMLLAEEGHAAMLVIPGDVPLISPTEVIQLLALHDRQPDFVIAPAHDQRGSNAVLCAPPNAVPLSYGNDSFEPHLSAARRSGIVPKVINLAGIGLDIDTAQSLEKFLQTPSCTRTYALLVDLVGYSRK
jgi:2-phospho-L-lactate guanylyltransferase